MAKFFIHRPVFAIVISLIILIAGGVGIGTLPIAQYPQIAPPTVEVEINYPGANAETASFGSFACALLTRLLMSTFARSRFAPTLNVQVST